MSTRKQRFAITALLTFIGLLPPALAFGFPPYHSTDADTADPWTLEARIGLVEIEREDHHNAYTSPLIRLNFGLPPHFEVMSEFAYDVDEEEVADAAVGIKWVPIHHGIHVGAETLLLLPVTGEQHGVGVDSVLAISYMHPKFRIHVNGGGFHDARPEINENGWKSSFLVQFTDLGRLRPGFEVYAKQVRHEDYEVVAGPGFRFDFGPFDFRAGVHFGLNEAAPDVAASFWITTKIPFRRQEDASSLEVAERRGRSR